MKTQHRTFLDLLPAPHTTLDSWRSNPPFPLLSSGRYQTALKSEKYEDLIEFIADGMQEFDQYDLDELFFFATKCYAAYCDITDEGAADSALIRKDFARLSYQLCLNFRDAIEHLDLHKDNGDNPQHPYVHLCCIRRRSLGEFFRDGARSRTSHFPAHHGVPADQKPS